MKRTVAVVAVALGLGVVGCSTEGAGSPAVVRNREALTSQNCTEDMDCWDCETMGDQVCGPAQRGIPTEAHDAWRDCFVAASFDRPNVYAAVGAAVCDVIVTA